MKKIVMFCGSLLIVAAMIFVACTPEEVQSTIQNYFRVESSQLISQEMPAPTSDQTINVSMNGNVIPGGSSYVTVLAENAVRKILIGLEGQSGYYEFTPTAANRDYAYSFVLMVDQNIEMPEGQESLNVQIAIIDENGDVSQVWQTPVEIIEVGTGGLQISLTFDNAKDVDLHVVEPECVDAYGDSLSFYDRHIYYGHRHSVNGGELDLDSNAGCSIDNVNNENITYNDSTAYIAPGEYKVYVDMWSNCDPTVPTNYVVTVLYGGNVIAATTGTNPYAGYFGIDYPDGHHGSSLGDLQPVLTFVIPEGNGNRVASHQPAPMTASAIEKQAISDAIYK